jgi:membrane-anchored protein YejM (alkaline phosphatase superfamily)
MHFPGVAPAVYESLSHHTDLVPTIAPWLGVTSPAGNYAVGGNLLDANYHRDFFVVFGWDTAVFANRNGKLFLPISFKSSYVRDPLTTFDDQPADNVDAFYSENAAQIQSANAEMMRPLMR